MKPKLSLNILLLIFSYSTISSCQVDKHELRGWDFRLFQDTKAWSLAKAVRDQDTFEIERQVKNKNVNVDFQEEIYGQSLLQLAVQNDLVISCKKLLNLGANPNHTDNANGESPMHNSVNTISEIDDTTILSLLIRYGGDPNRLNANISGKGSEKSPLMTACSKFNNFNRIKHLVENGADVNFVNSWGRSILSDCITSTNYDVVLYLLKTGKLNYKNIPFISASGQNQYIQDMMRRDFIDLKSPQYKNKLQVIEFLKNNGIDYRAAPIPESIVRRAKGEDPDKWQEYLDKY